jgi:hypothetical protein
LLTSSIWSIRVGTDARTRAALHSDLQENRFAELREGVWLRPDNLAVDLPDDVIARAQVLPPLPQLFSRRRPGLNPPGGTGEPSRNVTVT